MTPLTTTEKQRNRRRRLNEAAQAMGYPSWGKYETAVINKGDAKMETDDLEYYPPILSLYRDEYRTDAEYQAAYRDRCKHYGYQRRVDGGWIFYEFPDDYETAKKQK